MCCRWLEMGESYIGGSHECAQRAAFHPDTASTFDRSGESHSAPGCSFRTEFFGRAGTYCGDGTATPGPGSPQPVSVGRDIGSTTCTNRATRLLATVHAHLKSCDQYVGPG